MSDEVTEEKKGLFKKSATIAVYEDDDAAKYAEKYLKGALGALGEKFDRLAEKLSSMQVVLDTGEFVTS